jgi:flagellar motor protein MotB
MRLTPDHEGEINFWLVYSDLAMVMVLLLLLFILTQFVVNSQLLTSETRALVEAANIARQQEEAKKQQTTLQALLAREKQEVRRQQAELEAASRQRATLQETLALQTRARQEVEWRQARIRERFRKESGIRGIREDGSLQIFTFSADVLFPTDQAELSPRGDELLRSFGHALREHAEFYTRIEVEGHADEHASRNFFRPNDVTTDHGNWRLAAERAITVAQLFQRLGIAGEQLAVVGRSFYEPENPERFADRQRQEQAWAQNRRVQVRLFYSEIKP